MAVATAKKGLNEALLEVQKAAPTIQKDKVNGAFARGSNPSSKYASTDAVLAAILPVLNDNDLVLLQFPTTLGLSDPVPALRTRLTHVTSGEFIEDTAMLMLDKQNAQGLGGSITYMRRYAITSILGLTADVDDDGNKASEVEVVNARRTRTKAGSDNAETRKPPEDGGW